MVLSNLDVSNEAIRDQSNDPFIKSAADIYERILGENNDNVSTARFMQKREVKELYAELDLLILKRFNFAIKHISGEGLGYAITPIEPAGVNVLAGNINAKIDSLVNHLAKNPPKCREIDCIKDLGSDYKSVLMQVLESHKELTKTMNTSGVIIDEERAKIHGLTSEFKVLAIVDVPQLMKFKWGPMEFVAVLLHEIGHVFTHLSESYRTVKFTETIIESLEATENMPPKHRFKIINKRIFGKSTTFKDGDTEETMLINMQNSALEAISMNSNDVQSFAESERMADQFAARFGMGEYLGSALTKRNKTSYSFNPFKNNNVSSMLRLLILVAVLTGFVAFLSFVLVAALVTSAYIAVIYTAVTLVNGGEKARGKVYDVDKQRLIRIRNDEILTMRMINDEDIRTRKMESIRYLNSVIDGMPDDSFMEKLGNRMPWNSGNVKETEVLRDLEDGMNNILYVTSQSLKEAAKRQ